MVNSPKVVWRFLGAALLAASFTLAGCAADDGADGSPGTSKGTVAGTVTNSLTGDPLAGATVSMDPAVVSSVTTGADGTYSVVLPIGVYEITFEKENFVAETDEVSVVAGVTQTLDVALVPTAPVVLDIEVDGVAEPGNTLTATVTVTVLDGSTVESYAWSQVDSVEVEFGTPTLPTTTVGLPGVGAYKDQLIHFLIDPPIEEEDLPPNVDLPEGEVYGGLQNRFQVAGVNPYALEEAALVTLEMIVTTSSGEFGEEYEVHTLDLPWQPGLGLEQVTTGIPALLHGKDLGEGTVYDWSMTRPAGSSATLTDETSQNPYFTPDVVGLYTVTVTDTSIEPPEPVTLDITADTWVGAITGEDADGRPVSATCTVCHNGGVAPDNFTPWAQSGHAEIFSVNLDTSTHYSTSCLTCHTVGYDPEVDNGGIDNASDYQEFLDIFTSDGSHFIPNPNNWTDMLALTPASAQLANIQCENCHGPQPSPHFTASPQRISLSSDVCAVCHGEPLRHARFQQWQLSGHANYELAIDEGESGNCSRCHTANGFLVWLPILLGEQPGDPLANITVTWTPDETHPQTCTLCHEPHDPGSTTGDDTDATPRITGDTPPLLAGFQAFGVGKGAICMTCHNSRRGLRNDSTFPEETDRTRAPHGSAQTDIIMGQNAYLVEVGNRGGHSLITDTCVNCHMVLTPPPPLLSYNEGGTNHVFSASDDICSNCHGEGIDAEGLQQGFAGSLALLQDLVEDALLDLMTALIADGDSIDLNGEVIIIDAADIEAIEFGETRGRQAMTVTFTDGTIVGPVRMSDVEVLDASGEPVGGLYDFASDDLIKAGWNWNLITNDGSLGLHNPSFAFNALDASIAALDTQPTD